MYSVDKNLIKAKCIASKLEKELELLTDDFVCVNIENGDDKYKLAVTINDAKLIPFIGINYYEHDVSIYMYDLIED